MADYWIKLYLEILDDSKMAVMPDRLWRRVIELFLLAGRYHQDGALPDTRQLSWVLRYPVDDIEMDLKQIASTGIIQKTITGWFIPKFGNRQAAVPAAERMKAMREREHHKQYIDEDVTQQLRNVTQINRLTDTESYNTPPEKPAAPMVPSIDPVIPDSLSNEIFLETWNEWITYRKEIKHPMKLTTQNKQLKLLEKYPADISCAMLEQSMTNGWQGIFEIKPANGNGHKPSEAPEIR